MTDTHNAGALPVSALMGDEVVEVGPNADIPEVCQRLADDDIGAVALVDGDRATGIVSERDVVHAIAARRDLAATRARDIATTNLMWCDATATVAEVAEMMMEHFVRHILIEDAGRLAGIVSARDLLGAYAAEDIDID